jgi:hypothetical protein
MDIERPAIFMDIIEKKLHDILDLFLDGYEFGKNEQKVKMGSVK